MRWLLLAWILLLPSNVLAAKKPVKPRQPDRCGPAEQAMKGLRERYGEMPFAQLRDSDGHDLILFVGPQTWSWTMIQDTHDGKWCVIANGTDFKAADRKGLNKLGATPL